MKPESLKCIIPKESCYFCYHNIIDSTTKVSCGIHNFYERLDAQIYICDDYKEDDKYDNS